MKEFMIGEGKVTELTFIDLQKDKEVRIRSKTVVNATGPWVDRVLSNTWDGQASITRCYVKY